MKKFIVAALLAVGVSGSAFAAGSNDLILGFRATGGVGSSQNLQVDLGSFSMYKGQAAGTTVTITNLLTGSAFGSNTISAIYGSSWNTRADVLWGVAGTVINGQTGPGGEVGRSLYAAAIATGSLLDGTATSIGYNRASALTQGTPSAKIGGLYGAFGVNTVIAPQTSDLNSWSIQYGNTPAPFGYGTFPQVKFDNNTAISGSYVASDLYEMLPGTGAGTYLGTVGIFSNGDVTFTAAGTAAVPEPSTYAAIIGAAVLGFVALRRRNQLVAA